MNLSPADHGIMAAAFDEAQQDRLGCDLTCERVANALISESHIPEDTAWAEADCYVIARIRKIVAAR